MPDKVLIIGLDGADWRVLQPFLDEGLMPNLAHLVETGISGNLRSTVPTNSNVAWSTFLTGRNPGKHGIFDFVQRSAQNPLLMVSANSRSRRCETFLDTLGKYGQQIGAISIPSTLPPFPVNGFLLGGMTVRKGTPYTFPSDLAQELDEKVGGFPINCLRWTLMSDSLEELLDEAIAVVKQRARVLDYLVDHKDWNVLIQVFYCTDRLQHPLMHILDPMHPRHDRHLARKLGSKLRTVVRSLDEMLRRTLEQVGDDVVLMVLSDHGFRSVHKAIFVRELLAREGLLQIQSAIEPTRMARRLLRPLPAIAKRALRKMVPANRLSVGSSHEMVDLAWSQTQAYTTTLSSQGICVNLAGREPYGIVRTGDAYERLVCDIEELLLGERDPVNGQSVITSVLRADQLYDGPWVGCAPDLLFTPAPGYDSARGAKSHLSPFQWRTGGHDLDGIFVASGPGIKQGAKIDGAALTDIAPTVLYLTGVPIPETMDGQVLELFSDQRLKTAPPTFEQETTFDDGPDHVYKPEEERTVQEHLRDLGYL